MIKIIFPIKQNKKKTLLNHLKYNWSKHHILIKNQKIFDYYYKFKDYYNFLILIKNKKIISSMGLLFNKNKIVDIKKIFSINNQVVWLTVWCTNKELLGSDNLRLIHYLIKKIKKNLTIATVGCNLHTYKIYKLLGFKSGQLSHFYFINNKKKTFNLVNGVTSNKNFKSKNSSKLLKLDLKKNYFSILGLKKFEKDYKKDFEYFKKKYLDNKFLKYRFFFIKDEKFLRGFFISREDKFLNSKCLRLIEYFGDPNKISNLNNDFQNLCTKSNYEYIDFYNYGIEKKLIISSGLKLKKISNKLIIPNYFSPFIKKNIKLRFAFYPPSEKMILFKGDCDQDRPN